MSARFREIASGLEFPEGPVALLDGSVLVVELRAKCITRISPAGKKERIADVGGGPNGIAIGPDGKAYITNNGGMVFLDGPKGAAPVFVPEDYKGGSIQRLDLDTGQVELLYDRSDKAPLTSPNDIVFDRHGGFWFTDHGKMHARSLDRGALCYARIDGGNITEALFPIMTPNGIALSPDESVLYAAETLSARLWAFNLSGPGKIERLPFPSLNGGRLLVGLPGMQGMDSMAVDDAGNICVGTIMDNTGISVFSPKGDLLEHIPLPDQYPTNICFGGSDLRTAFITLSGTGKLIAMDWPRPGLPLNFLNR